MNKLIFSLCFLLGFTASAQKAETSLSMRDKALSESAVSEKESKLSATDAQISGTMLKLDDPTPLTEVRSWKYMAAFTAQQFQAQGIARNDMGQQFNLRGNSQTIMPGVEVGLLSPTWALGQANLTVGAKLKGSYASQSADAVMSSGYIVDDARLNSTLLSAGPTVTLAWERLSWLSLNLGAQFGDLNYTQTSSNEFARFSQHAGYTAYSYGLGFQINRTWSVTTEWNQRSLNSNQTVALQNNNFELGTQITW